MNDLALADWATAYFGIRRLVGGAGPPSVDHLNPCLAVARAVGAVFRPSSPVELFSDEKPTFTPPSSEEDGLVPIDDVLGRYRSSDQTIKIFKENIGHYAASVFGCNPDDLEAIVRVHEYAHGMVHLGVDERVDRKHLWDYPVGAQTEWKDLLAQRDAIFNWVEQETHEFLAQLICWKALVDLGEVWSGRRLRELFVKSMDRQPKRYRLPHSVLESTSRQSDLRSVLGWIHENPADRYPPPVGHGQRDVVEALAVHALSIR